MSEALDIAEKTTIAFGTYCQPDDIVATIDELLASRLSVRNLCIIGKKACISKVLRIMQNHRSSEVLWISLLTHTEPFVMSEKSSSSVGSSGALLNRLRRLIARQKSFAQSVPSSEYCIEGSDFKHQVEEGCLILFVSISDIRLIPQTLKTLLKKSHYNVHSHEYLEHTVS